MQLEMLECLLGICLDEWNGMYDTLGFLLDLMMRMKSVCLLCV